MSFGRNAQLLPVATDHRVRDICTQLIFSVENSLHPDLPVDNIETSA